MRKNVIGYEAFSVFSWQVFKFLKLFVKNFKQIDLIFVEKVFFRKSLWGKDFQNFGKFIR